MTELQNDKMTELQKKLQDGKMGDQVIDAIKN